MWGVGEGGYFYVMLGVGEGGYFYNFACWIFGCNTVEEIHASCYAGCYAVNAFHFPPLFKKTSNIKIIIARRSTVSVNNYCNFRPQWHRPFEVGANALTRVANVCAYLHRHMASFVHGHMASFVHGHMASFVHRHMASFVHTHMASFVHTHMASFVHTHMPSFVHTHMTGKLCFGISLSLWFREYSTSSCSSSSSSTSTSFRRTICVRSSKLILCSVVDTASLAPFLCRVAFTL